MDGIIKVAVQERQRLLREGLTIVLQAERDIEVVGAAADAAELVRVCETQRPDVVLLELDTDQWDAWRLGAALRERNRALRVVGLYGSARADLGQRSHTAGLSAAVSRAAGSATALDAVRAAGRRGAVVSAMPSRDGSPTTQSVLSAREQQVLELVGGGWTTREIAVRLAISPKTVEHHKQRIFAKLDVQSQAHAVAVALRSGMLPAHRPHAAVAAVGS